MNIRQMTAKDVFGVWEIENACFSMPWSEKDFYDELENPFGLTFVAEEKGEIIGFVNLRKIGGELYINNVAVKEGSRKKGVAKMLLSQIENEDYDFITLEVRESNLPAIRLYESAGYERVGIRKNFYEKPVENALLMTKTYRKE